eukprot:UN17709
MLIEAVDTNGRGALDYGEFLAVSLHLQRMANDEHLRRAFLFSIRTATVLSSLRSFRRPWRRMGRLILLKW